MEGKKSSKPALTKGGFKSLFLNEGQRTQALLDVVDEVVLLLDAEGVVRLINRKGCEILGLDEKNILGKNWFRTFVPREVRTETHRVFKAACRSEIDVSSYHENEIRTASGDRRWIHWHNVILRGKKKEDIGVLSAGSDVTERRNAEKSFQISEEKARSLFDGVPIPLYRSRPDGRILDGNPALLSLLGFADKSDLNSIDAWSLHADPENRRRWQALIDEKGMVKDYKTLIKLPDGSIRWGRDSARAVRDDHGNILYYEGSLEDITDRKKAEESVKWLLLVRTVLANLSEKLLTPGSFHDCSEMVLDYAKKLTRSPLGFVAYAESVSGEIIASALDKSVEGGCRIPERPDVFHRNRGLWLKMAESGKAVMSNSCAKDPVFSCFPKGHPGIRRFLAAPAFIEGSLAGFLALADGESDYTEQDLEVVQRLSALFAVAIQRMRIENELRELSLVDDLTGLYNRRGFLTLAGQQIKVAARSRREMLLLYADFDEMKAINDRLGHQIGDAALQETADILKTCFREADIVARIGGDEFVVLIIDPTEARPDLFIERVLNQLTLNNKASGRPYDLSLSLGLSRFDPMKPCSVEILIDRADRLMYEKKKNRRMNH